MIKIKTKYCPFCERDVPYINKEHVNWKTGMKTTRNYCSKCRGMIEEYSELDDKRSEEFGQY